MYVRCICVIFVYSDNFNFLLFLCRYNIPSKEAGSLLYHVPSPKKYKKKDKRPAVFIYVSIKSTSGGVAETSVNEISMNLDHIIAMTVCVP